MSCVKEVYPAGGSVAAILVLFILLAIIASVYNFGW